MTDPVKQDPIVARAIDELRALPSSDVAARRRIVDAAAAARVTPADVDMIPVPSRYRRVRLWTLGSVAAAAAVAGLVFSNLRRESLGGPRVATTSGAPAGLQPVANAGTDALPAPRQFVFTSRGAHSVSVVGDFNGWNPSRTPMTRAGGGDLWSVTIPLAPGRHMYGYMVDDSVLVLDPRAPKARDADLGAVGSVIVVGKP